MDALDWRFTNSGITAITPLFRPIQKCKEAQPTTKNPILYPVCVHCYGLIHLFSVHVQVHDIEVRFRMKFLMMLAKPRGSLIVLSGEGSQ